MDREVPEPAHEPGRTRQRKPISKLLTWGFVAAFVIPLLVVLIGSAPNARMVPPYPERIMAGGEVLTTRADIMAGQQVFQKYGLMDHGSVWGHGSLRGMDFSAHTLHMIGVQIRDVVTGARYTGDYSDLAEEDRAIVDAVVTSRIKKNTYDPATGDITLGFDQAYAFRSVQRYWENVFHDGDQSHGFLPDTVKTPEERRQIASFFYWTAWAAGTRQPGKTLTYTNNWPPDRSVGNVAPNEALLWSFGGILSLFLVLGLMIYIVHRYRFFITEESLVHLSQRICHAPITVSQRAVGKFLGVVVALFIAQILNGGLLAHYTVHPASFFYKSIAKWIPFSLAKSWHLQLGIFWIAVAWVASALYIAPLISRREPKKQGLLVNILFGAILIVAVGSLTGEALSIMGKLPGTLWFWLGHQGWEFLELGRLWQILLFVGLIGWIFISWRGLRGRQAEAHTLGLTNLYLLSIVLVVVFFGFGLMYNQHTHLSIADYWRWFVVHIWVEGIFEFFAVATAALLFVTLGLVTRESAVRAALLTAILSFAGGIIGMSHHYFWFGQATFWIGLGAVFSSLEPIPLIMLASRGWMEYKAINDAGVDFPYRWPLFFLVASAFWNFLGAGVFGFMINLPIVNYYEHATYLTSNHGHTALFGVYGMLAIALVLFVWRGLVDPAHWKDGWLKLSFWGLNGGLFLMFIMSLLPMGIMQFVTSYTEGMWLAKSAEFFNRPIIQLLGSLRAIPDTILIVFGALPLAWFSLDAYLHMKPVSVRCGEEIAIEEK